MHTPYPLLPNSVLHPQLFYYLSSGLASIGGVLTILGSLSLAGEFANRVSVARVRRRCDPLRRRLDGNNRRYDRSSPRAIANAITSFDMWFVGLIGGALIMMSLLVDQAKEDCARVENLANLIYRSMQVGVVLLAAGTIVGSAWAHNAWGGYWHWTPRKFGR